MAVTFSQVLNQAGPKRVLAAITTLLNHQYKFLLWKEQNPGAPDQDNPYFSSPRLDLLTHLTNPGKVVVGNYIVGANNAEIDQKIAVLQAQAATIQADITFLENAKS